MKDGTERLCDALYGRNAKPSDYIGGANARMLHDAANWINDIQSMLRDDALVNSSGMLRREHTSVQEARYAAIDDYRARLLAKIDERKDAQ